MSRRTSVSPARSAAATPSGVYATRASSSVGRVRRESVSGSAPRAASSVGRQRGTSAQRENVSRETSIQRDRSADTSTTGGGIRMPSYARTSSLAARTRSDASFDSAGGGLTALDGQKGDEADANTADGGDATAEPPLLPTLHTTLSAASEKLEGSSKPGDSPEVRASFLSSTPRTPLSAASKRIGRSSKPGDSPAHVPSAEQVPVSAYVRSSKKLKDITDVTPGRMASPPRLSSAARERGGSPARLSQLLSGNAMLENSSRVPLTLHPKQPPNPKP